MYAGSATHGAWGFVSLPVGIVAGIGTGSLVGFALYKVFERFNPRATKRALALIGIAVLLVQVGNWLGDRGLPFAGLLAVMAIGFVILEKRGNMAREISLKLAKIWVFAEIVQFAFTGASIDFQTAAAVGARGAALIMLALAARSIGAWLSTAGMGYGAKERLFVVIANLPKATIQAAFGAAPLSLMRARGMPTAPGEAILAVAVLSIVLTAPAGAWAIEWAGKRLLNGTSRSKTIQEERL
jgi:hypothetical protein